MIHSTAEAEAPNPQPVPVQYKVDTRAVNEISQQFLQSSEKVPSRKSYRTCIQTWWVHLNLVNYWQGSVSTNQFLINFATSVLISLIVLSSRYDMASVLSRYLQSVCPRDPPVQGCIIGLSSVDWLSRYLLHEIWTPTQGWWTQWTDNIWYYLLYTRNRTSSGNIQNFTNIRKQSEKFSISGLIPNILLTATVPHPLEHSREDF